MHIYNIHTHITGKEFEKIVVNLKPVKKNISLLNQLITTD